MKYSVTSQPNLNTSEILKARNILVVEDDYDTAEAIKFSFEKGNTKNHQSHTCTVAHDAYEALNFLSDNKFDLVLVDERLPGMNGSKVLDTMDTYIDTDPLISESEMYFEKVPVVMMSGSKFAMTEKMSDLNHFDVKKVIQKSQLPGFISTLTTAV